MTMNLLDILAYGLLEREAFCFVPCESVCCVLFRVTKMIYLMIFVWITKETMKKFGPTKMVVQRACYARNQIGNDRW